MNMLREKEIIHSVNQMFSNRFHELCSLYTSDGRERRPFTIQKFLGGKYLFNGTTIAHTILYRERKKNLRREKNQENF